MIRHLNRKLTYQKRVFGYEHTYLKQVSIIVGITQDAVFGEQGIKIEYFNRRTGDAKAVLRIRIQKNPKILEGSESEENRIWIQIKP
jgi:hypothetical protein